ncbi:hypothetical protein COCON_G00058710 [Conger conger]|uniref:Uncharacterized protein n=1 Tax=Conger conger TaxID=82655 RepID=A0A9Q1DQU2_CONCO|nr:hypothetical protein COCON_G00058710 [Conger conger]
MGLKAFLEGRDRPSPRRGGSRAAEVWLLNRADVASLPCQSIYREWRTARELARDVAFCSVEEVVLTAQKRAAEVRPAGGGEEDKDGCQAKLSGTGSRCDGSNASHAHTDASEEDTLLRSAAPRASEEPITAEMDLTPTAKRTNHSL